MRLVSLLLLLCACDAGTIETVRPVPLDAADAGPPGPSSDAGAATVPSYRTTVHGLLVGAGCTACHAYATVPMRIRPDPLTETEWRESYEEVRARAGTLYDSPLLSHPTGAEAHPRVLGEGAPELDALRTWIDGGAIFAPGDAPELDPIGDPADPADPGAPGYVSFERDIEPILVARDCRRCHGDRGAYSLESFEGVMGPGSDDVPNVIPGDPDSLLIDYCRDGHQGLTYPDALTILSWVVEFDARAR